jgi:Flp pilus assembly protein TadD
MKAAGRKWIWLQAALILLAGAYVFGPSLGGGWLWDDNQEVTENAVLRDPAGLAKIWTGAAGADYFPLKTSLQWFGWQLWGDAPAGYHALSLLFHLLSAFLFWRLLRQLGVRLAWLGGLLFVVHPVAVESVAWAAELKNTLSLALLLLAMLACVRWRERDPKTGEGGLGAYGLSLLCFVLAMLAKSSVVMFPVVLLLYAWWRHGRIGRRDVRASLPFFAVSLGLGLVTYWFQHHRAMPPAEIAALAGGPLSRVAGAGLALAFYLRQCLLPLGLSPIYPRWTIDPPSAVQFLPWVGFGILTAWLWTKRAGWGRPVLFALGFFALNLLPVLGFTTMTYMHITWVADHFAYLSLLAVIGLAVAALGRLGRRGPPGFIPTALALVVAAALAVESRGYAAVFQNQDSLWTYTLRRNPDSWQAHYNLATYLARRGEWARALTEFGETLRLRPGYGPARNNLGNTLLMTGRLAEATAQYAEAVRQDPAYADARLGLGNALFQAGRVPEAIAQFQEALRLQPGSALAHANLGNALAYSGRLPEAAAEFEEALRLQPGDPRIQAHLNVVLQALHP